MFERKTKVEIVSPFPGQIVDMTEVPDDMFNQKMLGDGFAVVPGNESSFEVCAPVAGKLAKVFQSGHAFAMISNDGLEILVHIGLETVELGGKGFEILKETGETVEAGTPVIRVDADLVRAENLNLITPVVFTKGSQIAKWSAPSAGSAGSVTLA